LGIGLLSAFVGVIYLLLERASRRPQTSIVLAQFVCFLFGVVGFVKVDRFWWRVLAEEHPANPQMPIRSAELMLLGFTASLILFVVNIVSSRRTPPRTA
jgi:hypothetical protein